MSCHARATVYAVGEWLDGNVPSALVNSALGKSHPWLASSFHFLLLIGTSIGGSYFTYHIVYRGFDQLLGATYVFYALPGSELYVCLTQGGYDPFGVFSGYTSAQNASETVAETGSYSYGGWYGSATVW